MSYLNRFIIEEETQFECNGVFELDQMGSQIKIPLWNRAMDQSSEFHVFIAAGFSLVGHFRIQRLLFHLRSRNGMITCIGSERLESVQKEEYENFYKEKGRVRYKQRYDQFLVFDVRESIGNGIEDFFQLVKTKEITVHSTNIKRFCWGFESKYSLGRPVTHFHLSMLTEEKQNEIITQKRNSGRKCPDFKNDTKLSEKEHNYALSICFRKTAIYHNGAFHEVVDPDSTRLYP